MKLPGSRIIVGGIKVEGKEARKLIRDAFKDARRHSTISYKPLLLSILAGVVVFGAYITGVITLIPAWPEPWRSLAIGCGGIIFGVILGRTISVVHLRANKKSIFRAMRSLGFELCTNCGYWLKGLSDDTTKCPECGWQRDLEA